MCTTTSMARRYLLAGVAGLALAVAAGTAGAQTPVLGPLVQVTDQSVFNSCTADDTAGQAPSGYYANSNVEPFAATDPTRAGTVLIGVQQDRWNDGGSRGLRGAISTNSGASYALSQPQNAYACTGGTYQRATDPWVSYGPDGLGYFSTLAFNNAPAGTNGPSAVYAHTSTDHGATWGDAIPLIQDNGGSFFNDKNSITADPKLGGYAYSVWDRLAGNRRLFLDPGGSDEQPAADAAGDKFKTMQRFRQGTLFAPQAVTPAAILPTGPSYFSRTINGGASWSTAVPIYRPGSYQQTIGNVVVVLPDGRLLDFYDHIFQLSGVTKIGFVSSSDQGVTWSRGRDVLSILGNGATTPDAGTALRDGLDLFSVAVDPTSGAIYVVWENQPNTAKPVGVSFSRSLDGGATWSAPVKINKTPANATVPGRGQAFTPTIAVGPGGLLAVTYFDFRRDTSVAGFEGTDVWAVFCKPSSTVPCTKAGQWGKEVRLTPSSFNMADAPVSNGRGLFIGDYQGLVAQGNSFYAAFIGVTGASKSSLFSRRIDIQ